jgi:hypothetical protein
MARAARRAYFRALVALLFLAVHLAGITHFAAIHFAHPFNNAPGEAPTFESGDYTTSATNWNRLVVSRWDSGQYICMTLDRIYGHCPKQDLRQADLHSVPTCQFAFYPGYSIIGWFASLGCRLPVDYALWGVSLAASFVLLFLWTGPIVVQALGVWGAYCSLFLFNLYSTGFTLVTVLSEPCTLLFIFGAFLCVEKRRFVLGALLAGAASGMRITGLCAPVAYVCAIHLWAWDQDKLTVKQGLRTVLSVPLSAWGILTMMAYQWWRFNDPLIYAHAHSQMFEHEPRLWHLFWPDAAWIVKSMRSGVHEVAVAAIMALWFALGHRQGLRRFSRPGQVYLYVQFLVAFCLPLYGSAQLGYTGVTRYMLTLFGAFFAMGALLKDKPLALLVWCTMSGWNYWHTDLCYFEQHLEDGGMDRCLVNAEPPKPEPSPTGH